MPATFYIALGTNLGDRHANLIRAVQLLTERVDVLRRSSIYETEAAYVEDQPAFLNMVLYGRARTDPMSPHQLLQFGNEIERRMGRERLLRYGPRLIDVDILTYDKLQIQEPDLIIPHPRIAERDFVLVPLMEIAPNLVLPGQTVSVAALAQRLPGTGKIIRVESATPNSDTADNDASRT